MSVEILFLVLGYLSHGTNWERIAETKRNTHYTSQGHTGMSAPATHSYNSMEHEATEGMTMSCKRRGQA